MRRLGVLLLASSPWATAACGSSGSTSAPDAGSVGGAGGVGASGGAAGSGGGPTDSGTDACATSCTGPSSCGTESCACAGGVQGPVYVACQAGCCANKSLTCVGACTMLGCGPGPGTGSGSPPAKIANIPSAVFIDLAVDSSSIFYADIGNNVVARIPIGGGSPQILASTTTPMGLTLDGNDVYWVNQAGDVGRVSKTGTGAQVLATALGGSNGGIAVDASNVYLSAGSNTYLLRLPKTGGTPIQLGHPGSYPGDVHLDGGFVYATTSSSGKLVRVPAAGGNLEQLGTVYPNTASFAAIAGGTLYFTSDNSVGSLYGWPLAGGSVKAYAGLQDSPSRIAADSTHVYFAQRVCNKVLKMPLGGGALTLVGQSTGSFVGLALSATHVYVGTQSSEILSFPK